MENKSFDSSSAYKQVLLDVQRKAHKGRASKIQKEMLRLAKRSEKFGEFAEGIEKKHPVGGKSFEGRGVGSPRENMVMDNITLKIGETQAETEILQPKDFLSENISSMFEENEELRKEFGEIEKIEEADEKELDEVIDKSKEINEKKKEIQKAKELKAAYDKIEEIENISYTEKEILPKEYFKGTIISDPDLPVEPRDGGDIIEKKYFPERLEYLKEKSKSVVISITTKNSRGLGRYFGFEIEGGDGEKYIVCDSLKSGNALFIFKMEIAQENSDIFKNKTKAKASPSFVKKINHTENYKNRFEKFMKLA